MRGIQDVIRAFGESFDDLEETLCSVFLTFLNVFYYICIVALIVGIVIVLFALIGGR